MKTQVTEQEVRSMPATKILEQFTAQGEPLFENVTVTQDWGNEKTTIVFTDLDGFGVQIHGNDRNFFLAL